jgi:hypothetical protein
MAFELRPMPRFVEDCVRVELGERVRHHVTKRDWLEDFPSPEKTKRAVAAG